MAMHRFVLVENLGRFANCLIVTGALAGVGCGNSGEGTVQVSPEARARLTPRVPVMTRGPKGRIVEQRPIGNKNRGVSSTKAQ
jgi:hypothetical protein